LISAFAIRLSKFTEAVYRSTKSATGSEKRPDQALFFACSGSEESFVFAMTNVINLEEKRNFTSIAGQSAPECSFFRHRIASFKDQLLSR